MVKFLEQRQLVAKGLTCGKARRRTEENKFLGFLEKSLIIRVFILLAIIGSFAVLIFIDVEPYAWKRLFVTILLFIASLASIELSDHETARSNSRLALVFGTILLQLGIIKLLFVKAVAGGIDEKFLPLLIPYGFAPLTLSVLTGKRGGLFATVLGSLWGAFLFERFDPFFLIISLTTGFIVVIATMRVRRRSRIIRAGLYAGLTTWILGIIFGQIGPFEWSCLFNINCPLFMLQSITSVSIGVLTAVIVSGLLPILENLFRVTTDISWLEMADLNHPLLRRLSLEASGTYQHSLSMAALAESAAEAIGANPTICRVGAYFHDIGKLIKPEYFTENISAQENPHDALTPTMSALIISAHIKEGVDLAYKNKLHPRVIDIIRQHHGTTMIGYFFQKACLQQEDARLGGKIINIRPEDIPAVDISSFRYPGPKPQTKEAAIIGLADAAESASRSMEQPTPQRIGDLVKSLLEERLHDGQYDECPITMAELHKVADSLVTNLIGMLHSRISYKKRSQQKEEIKDRK